MRVFYIRNKKVEKQIQFDIVMSTKSNLIKFTFMWVYIYFIIALGDFKKHL